MSVKKIKPKGIKARSDFRSHPLGIAIFFLVLGVLVVSICILRVLTDQSRTFKTAVVKNVNPQVAAEVNKKLVYNLAGVDRVEYYSPLFDILLSYNPKKFRFEEATEETVGLSYYPDVMLPAFFEMGELRKVPVSRVDTDINNYFIKLYDYDFHRNFKVLEQKTEGDLSWLKLTYEFSSVFDESKTIAKTHVICSRQIGDNYYAITLGLEAWEDADALLADFKEILSSVTVSPKEVAANIDLELKEAGMKVSFDREKWQVRQSTTGDWFYLDSIPVDDKNHVHFEVIARKGEKNLDAKTYGQTMIQESIEEIKKSPEVFKDLKIISQGEKITLGGLTFDELKFSHKGWSGLTVTTSYFGFNTETGYGIEITFIVHDEESEQAKSVTPILESIQFVNSEKISGQSNKNQVLGTASVQIDKASLVGINSVVHIFNRSCAQIQVAENIQELTNTSGKNYKYCSAALGSGFFVSKDGYVVTNAHVAHYNPKDIVINSLMMSDRLSGFWLDFLNDINSYLVGEGESMDVGMLISYGVVSFLDLIDQGLITLTADYNNYIETTEPFEISKETLELVNNNGKTEARLVETPPLESLYELSVNQAISEQIQPIKEPDLALLKVEPFANVEEFPFLNVANINSVVVGQSIQVIGFPGIADERMLFSAVASSIPTLTKGTVSAIKPSSDGNFNLVQIDASISHGNSGGPIINQEAQVVGVSTYGLGIGESADINLGVGSDAVLKLVEKNGISSQSSRVVELIESGVDNLGKSYFKWAIRDFNEAMLLYPLANGALQPMVVLAQEKINNQEDKTPLFKIGSLEIGLSQMIIIGVGLVLIMAGIVITMIVLKKKKEKQGPTPPINYMPPISPSNPAGQEYTPPSPTATS